MVCFLRAGHIYVGVTAIVGFHGPSGTVPSAIFCPVTLLDKVQMSATYVMKCMGAFPNLYEPRIEYHCMYASLLYRMIFMAGSYY